MKFLLKLLARIAVITAIILFAKSFGGWIYPLVTTAVIGFAVMWAAVFMATSNGPFTTGSNAGMGQENTLAVPAVCCLLISLLSVGPLGFLGAFLGLFGARLYFAERL